MKNKIHKKIRKPDDEWWRLPPDYDILCGQIYSKHNYYTVGRWSWKKVNCLTCLKLRKTYENN